MKLNNKMAALIDNIDAFKGAVLQQYQDVYHDLALKINFQLMRYENLKFLQIKDFNNLAKGMDVDVIKIKK